MTWLALAADNHVVEQIFDHGIPLEVAMVLDKAKPGTFQILHRLDPYTDARLAPDEVRALAADLQVFALMPSLVGDEQALSDLIRLVERCRVEGLALEFRGV